MCLIQSKDWKLEWKCWLRESHNFSLATQYESESKDKALIQLRFIPQPGSIQRENSRRLRTNVSLSRGLKASNSLISYILVNVKLIVSKKRRGKVNSGSNLLLTSGPGFLFSNQAGDSRFWPIDSRVLISNQ